MSSPCADTLIANKSIHRNEKSGRREKRQQNTYATLLRMNEEKKIHAFGNSLKPINML
jgi:acid stress-induced BolA-like protein IbaG/YrbA